MAAGVPTPAQAGPVPAEPATPPQRTRPALVAGLATVAVLAAVLAVAALVLRLLGDDDEPTARPVATASPSETPPTVSDVFAAVAPSVVVVRTENGALGTGTVVADDGTILTANHVVADGSPVTVVFSDGTESQAAVASADPGQDIATLTPAGLPDVLVPATLGGGAQPGADVIVIGNPLGLTYSVSSGIVSGLDRTTDESAGNLTGLIQFDASVNPGSSGGPLLDGDGLVVGVVVAIADPGKDDAFAGIGFAVPIATALAGGDGDGAGGGGPQI
ncbi:S1C family serine protease [Nocardioides sp.]|uniref:S1C family serine protease n=1 Tax=Nocardioides sp. TaxID=35761 RepID=UPI0039E49EAC